jgi:putative PIN family toxin of toxin-antitoxin system
MIRVVLDTNVIVSALLKEQGGEAAVLRLALKGIVELAISEPLLVEYEDVLFRPKFKRPADVVTSLLADITSVGHLVRPTHRVTAISHESDNRFLECAEAAQADFLVTGNKRHFPHMWKSTKIVNARELIEHFAGQQS